jgi:hypothetical protein
MAYKEIELGKIDFSDETFLITENLNSEPLLKSLREIGQLNPVILLERDSHAIVICGFRRVQALKRLGSAQVLARIIPENSCEPANLFHLALSDNLSHRQLDPLEKARALFKLKNSFSIAEDVLVKLYLPLLGLSPHESVLHSYIKLDGAHPGLRQCLVDNRLTLSSLETIAQMPDESQESMVALMGKLRLSASLQRKLFDILEDLAAIDCTQPGKALEDPEALLLLGSAHLSPFQKGEKLYEFLYRKRNPRLSQATERFCEKRKSLGLPGLIKIVADPFFENPGIRVEFQAPNVERFREMVSALEKSAQTQTIEELFQI